MQPGFYRVTHYFVFHNYMQSCATEALLITSPISQGMYQAEVWTFWSSETLRLKKRAVRNSVLRFLKKGKGENSNSLHLEVLFTSKNTSSLINQMSLKDTGHVIGVPCSCMWLGNHAQQRREMLFPKHTEVSEKGKKGSNDARGN